MKKIEFGREKVFAGMDLVYRLAAPTSGPNGQNVVLDRGFSAPIITNDGVSIAEAAESDDFTEKQGIDLFKHMAKKTREQAGDGTTGTIILAHALIKEGMKHDNGMEVKRSLEAGVIKVIEKLKKVAKEAKTDKEILQVATVATESEDLGQMILDTIKAIGRTGVISVEQSQGRETQVSVSEGYIVEKGYSNVATGLAAFKNPKVLVIGEKIQSVHDVTPILDKCVQGGIREVVLFCVEMEPEVLNAIAEFWNKQLIKVLVIKANTQKQEVLHDIALLSGAEYISQDAGHRLADITLGALGEAKKVISGNGKTTIIDGKGSVKEKVAELKAELLTTTDPNDFDLIEKRIARLNHEVATISVGAPTEEAMQYLFYKIQNGVNSTKASIEEGIVEGGGMALHRIAEELGNSVGEKILKVALKAPMKQIIENGSENYTQILLGMPEGKGYNAKSGEYVDLYKAGIIDPLKVIRCEIENAVSLAATFITTHASIALIRKLE